MINNEKVMMISDDKQVMIIDHVEIDWVKSAIGWDNHLN